MRLRGLSAVSVVAIVGLLLMTLGVGPALAATLADDEAEKVEFTGKVISIIADPPTLEVEVEKDGETVTYTVYVSDDSCLESLSAGDLVEIEGVLDEDGSVDASKVKLKDADDDEGEDGEAAKDCKAGFCRDFESFHPVAAGLAMRYDLPYEGVMGWFCEGRMGMGQIMLALQTARMQAADDIEEDAEDAEEEEELGQALFRYADSLLARRRAGEGWGQIWQDLGTKRNGQFAAEEPNDEAGDEQLQAAGGARVGPPGQLKKGDKPVPPGQLKKDEKPLPPGQQKKAERSAKGKSGR